MWPELDHWVSPVWLDENTLVATSDDQGRGSVWIGAPTDPAPRRLAGGPGQDLAFSSASTPSPGTAVVVSLKGGSLRPLWEEVPVSPAEVTGYFGPIKMGEGEASYFVVVSDRASTPLLTSVVDSLPKGGASKGDPESWKRGLGPALEAAGHDPAGALAARIGGGVLAARDGVIEGNHPEKASQYIWFSLLRSAYAGNWKSDVFDRAAAKLGKSTYLGLRPTLAAMHGERLCERRRMVYRLIHGPEAVMPPEFCLEPRQELEVPRLVLDAQRLATED